MIEKLLPYKDKILVLIDQIWVSGCHFLIGILLTRFLGLETYGVFALIWMIVLFVSSIHSAAIVIPMLTIAPQKKEGEQERFLASLNIFQLAFGLLVIPLAFSASMLLSAFFADWGIQDHSLILSFLAVCFIFHDFLRKKFYLAESYVKAMVLDVVAYTPQVIGLIVLFQYNSLSLENALILILFSYFFAAIIFVKEFSFSRFDFSKLKIDFLESWEFSKWLLGKSVLQWSSANFFIVAAGSILGPLAMGGIRIAQNVMGVLNVLFLAIENYIPIQAAKAFANGGKSQLITYLKGISLPGLLIVSVLAGLIFLFAAPINSILFDVQSAESTFLLRGYSILYIIIFCGIPLRFVLRTLNVTKSIFISYCINSALSFFLAVPMIKHWGMWGLLAGLIGTQLIMQFYFLFVLNKRLI